MPPKRSSVVFTPTEPPLLTSLDARDVYKYIRQYDDNYVAVVEAHGGTPLGHQHCVDRDILKTLLRYEEPLTEKGGLWEGVETVNDLTSAQVLAYLEQVAAPRGVEHIHIDVKTGATAAGTKAWNNSANKTMDARVVNLVAAISAYAAEHGVEQWFDVQKAKTLSKMYLSCMDGGFAEYAKQQLSGRDDESYSTPAKLFSILRDLARKWAEVAPYFKSAGAKADHKATTSGKPRHDSNGAKLQKGSGAVGSANQGANSKGKGAKPNAQVPAVGGCLKCKGAHFLRDCPTASDAEKKNLLKAFRANMEAKRGGTAARRTTATPDTGDADAAASAGAVAATDTNTGDADAAASAGAAATATRTHCTAATPACGVECELAGNVRVPGALDTGADLTLMSRATFNKVQSASSTPIPTEAIVPLPIHGAIGNGRATCRMRCILTLKLSSHAGPVVVRDAVVHVVDAPMSELLVGQDTLHRLGIDVYRDLQRYATSQARIPVRVLRVAEARTAAGDSDDDMPALLHSDDECDSDAVDSDTDAEEDEPPKRVNSDSASATDDEVDAARGPADPCPLTEVELETELLQGIDDMVDRAIKGGLPPEFRARLHALCMDYIDVFRVRYQGDPPAKVTPLKIRLKPDAQPRVSAARRYSPEQQAYMQERVEHLVKHGLVYRNNASTWAAPVHCVRRPDGKLRLTVDLRYANSQTIPLATALPHMDVLQDYFKEATIFSSWDHVEGYWQHPLAEESREVHSFRTHDGVYTPTVLIQGAADSTGAYQAAMNETLSGIMFGRPNGAVCWIDDILAYARSVEEWFELTRAILERFRERGFKVSVRKTSLFMREAKWCGKLVSSEGVRHDPERIAALAAVPFPDNAGELQQFVCAVNWMRGSIPDFAATIAPLQELLKTALAPLPRKDKVSALRIPLATSGVTAEHRDAFERVKRLVQAAVPLAHPSDAQELCLFTDASDKFWGAIVTQVPLDDLALPFADQRHQPLAFLSGAFKGAELHWPTIDKEGYAIVAAVQRCDYLLDRAKPFHVFTDHRNLTYLYNPLAPDGGMLRRHAAERIQRWTLMLSRFRYVVEHITGEDNVWADLLSRWGAGPAAPVAAARARSHRSSSDFAPAASFALLPPDFAWPALSDIRTAQLSFFDGGRELGHVTPPDLATWSSFKLFESDDVLVLDDAVAAMRATADAVLTDPQGRIWLPDVDHLRLRVAIIGHCGSVGHRGRDPTIGAIAERFWWPTLRQDVAAFCAQCIHCLPTRGGARVPRPLGTSLKGTAPNKVLHFDYLYIRAPPKHSAHGMQYVFVIKDSFSGYVDLTPTKGPTAAAAAAALIDWFATFGVSTHWVSDQGTHFKNQLMTDLATRLKVQHHFTVAHTHYPNGTVERANRDVIALLTALASEYKVDRDEWPSLLPIVQMSINQTALPRLGNQTPLRVLTGLSALHPLDAIVHPTITGMTVVPVAAPLPAEITAYVDALARSLADIHAAVDDAAVRDHATQETRRAVRLVNWEVGDYVLVARVDRDAKDKLFARWHGPFVVTNAVNDLVFEVRHLIENTTRVVHAERLRLYSDAHLQMTEAFLAQIAHDGSGFVVDAFVGHRRNRRGFWELRVRWLGFEDSEDTWEPATQLKEDVPILVRRYINALPGGDDKTSLKTACGL